MRTRYNRTAAPYSRARRQRARVDNAIVGAVGTSRREARLAGERIGTPASVGATTATAGAAAPPRVGRRLEARRVDAGGRLGLSELEEAQVGAVLGIALDPCAPM